MAIFSQKRNLSFWGFGCYGYILRINMWSETWKWNRFRIWWLCQVRDSTNCELVLLQKICWLVSTIWWSWFMSWNVPFCKLSSSLFSYNIISHELIFFFCCFFTGAYSANYKIVDSIHQRKPAFLGNILNLTERLRFYLFFYYILSS